MGMGVGAAFKLLSGGFAFWSETTSYTIKSYQGTIVSIDAIASLMGVGFIVGTKTGAWTTTSACFHTPGGCRSSLEVLISTAFSTIRKAAD